MLVHLSKNGGSMTTPGIVAESQLAGAVDRLIDLSTTQEPLQHDCPDRHPNLAEAVIHYIRQFAPDAAPACGEADAEPIGIAKKGHALAAEHGPRDIGEFILKLLHEQRPIALFDLGGVTLALLDSHDGEPCLPHRMANTNRNPEMRRRTGRKARCSATTR